MALDWKKSFTPQQLAIIEANTVPKILKRCIIPLPAENAEESKFTQMWVQSTDTSSDSTGKSSRYSDERVFVPGGSPIGSGSACKVESEAPSASLISIPTY